MEICRKHTRINQAYPYLETPHFRATFLRVLVNHLIYPMAPLPPYLLVVPKMFLTGITTFPSPMWLKGWPAETSQSLLSKKILIQ